MKVCVKYWKNLKIKSRDSSYVDIILTIAKCNITDLALCMMISSPPTNLIELTLGICVK